MVTDAQNSQAITPPPLLPLAMDLAIQYPSTDTYSTDPDSQPAVFEPYMCIPTGEAGDFRPLKVRSSSWLGRALLTEEPSTFTLPYHSGSKRDGTETASKTLRRLSVTPLGGGLGGGSGGNDRGGNGTQVDYGDDPTVLRQLLQQACIHTDTDTSGPRGVGTSASEVGSESEDEEEEVGGRGEDRSAAGDSDGGGGSGAMTTAVLAVPLTLTTPTNPVHAANANAGAGVSAGVSAGAGGGAGAGGDAVAGGKGDAVMSDIKSTGWRCLGMMLISVRSPDTKDPTALSESQLMWAAGEYPYRMHTYRSATLATPPSYALTQSSTRPQERWPRRRLFGSTKSNG